MRLAVLFCFGDRKETVGNAASRKVIRRTKVLAQPLQCE